MTFPASHLIILAGSVFPLTLVITYGVSVYSNHVYPFLPFMSYTGDFPIESCIFSLGVNLAAGIIAAIMYLRYVQMMKAFEGERTMEAFTVKKSNFVSFQWGIISVLGLSIAGCFQQCNAYYTHLVGAALCSYCGFAYAGYQTVLSRKLVGREHGMGMVYYRAILCLSNAACLLYAPLLLIYLELFYSRSHEETICWNQHEEGWYIHLCSSVGEWLMFVTSELFLISFYSEFKRIRISAVEISFNENK